MGRLKTKTNQKFHSLLLVRENGESGEGVIHQLVMTCIKKKMALYASFVFDFLLSHPQNLIRYVHKKKARSSFLCNAFTTFFHMVNPWDFSFFFLSQSSTWNKKLRWISPTALPLEKPNFVHSRNLFKLFHIRESIYTSLLTTRSKPAMCIASRFIISFEFIWWIECKWWKIIPSTSNYIVLPFFRFCWPCPARLLCVWITTITSTILVRMSF